MSPKPHAVVLTAPDGCTNYLKKAVEKSFRQMDARAILEVPCPDVDTRAELADWCLSAGIRIVEPFEHAELGRLLVENNPARLS